MKLSDKKAERTLWLALLVAIPFVLFVIWKERGTLGTPEIIIAAIAISAGIVLLYFVKWYANRN